MDYRVYHAVNRFVFHHAWLGRALADIEKWAVPVVAVATFALWLLARPGGSRKLKLASATALASAALGLLVNQLVAPVLAPGTAIRGSPVGACLGQQVS